MSTPLYCHSRKKTVRLRTREVMVGDVGVGGDNPIRIQSMTTAETTDVAATVRQSIALAEAGCEIIRITAPSKRAATALGEIRRKLNAAGILAPLVADIHFTPQAAMEAAEHVEKVRINPGNYADRKKFKQREYSDSEYESEIQRLYDAFSPLVIRCRELGRSMRIGTNHGSLSDRIMNRYGDTPLGMVESAMEFIRIAESHGYHDIILSMKASNPKVMIEAYRLAVVKMKEENMNYPLHLGVTEAGDGEDARIKSAIGIGALLYDGLGDTIRVSLTEDPVYEVPVARDLAERAMALWNGPSGDFSADAQSPAASKPAVPSWVDGVDPFSFRRRPVFPLEIHPEAQVSESDPPFVILPTGHSPANCHEIVKEVARAHARLRDSRIEGLMLRVERTDDIADIERLWKALSPTLKTLVLEITPSLSPADWEKLPVLTPSRAIFLRHFSTLDSDTFLEYFRAAQKRNAHLAVVADEETLRGRFGEHLSDQTSGLILAPVFRRDPEGHFHPLGAARSWLEVCRQRGIRAPFWIRVNPGTQILERSSFSDCLLEASLFAGPLLCDGFGDLFSIESFPQDLTRSTALAYNVLQGARARISKTEFIACPSCGRTLFDLQSTTQQIRARTGHLKGVTIAIMGCIVNGPGEMADADFGYVGGAPGKVNLYAGRTPVKYNVPEGEAVDQLVDLIREHGRWIEPESGAAEPEVSTEEDSHQGTLTV